MTTHRSSVRADNKSERRLAAIMFTDMIGYTALSQRNEALSLSLLERQRSLIRPALARHGGKEIKTMGDAFLAEFGSALNATRCAYDIQRSIRETNTSLPDEEKLHMRIGIHVGDVVESRGDISGDAVNVASRIEPLAEDGGVCLTQQVYDHVQNKFELSLTSLGPKTLKGVNVPMELYRMVMPWKVENATLGGQLDSRRVAVLPFANISPNHEDEYFADGMTDELISTISKIREIRVIARTSATKYKGSGKGIAEIGKELRVGSILEGTVRKVHDKLRITAQLIDSQSEEYLWSESYDRELQDAFTIQSDIAQRVADALSIRLISTEKKDITSKPTENSEAYQLYLRGRFYWNQRSEQGNDMATKYFGGAARLDQGFALAYAGLADCYHVSADYGWRVPREGYPKAVEYASKALELDPRLGEAHATLGWAYSIYEWSWNKAELELQRSIELSPSYATAYQWYALFLTYMGRLNEASVQIKRARELDPLSRVISLNQAMILLVTGRTAGALEQCQKLVEQEPDYADGHRFLGFLYFMSSRGTEAIEEARKALLLSEDDAFMKAELACLLGFVGKDKESSQILEELQNLSKTKYVPTVELAQILFSLGKTDEAFLFLNKADEDRSSRLLWFSIWPWFKDFRKDPRWSELQKVIGIPAEMG